MMNSFEDGINYGLLKLGYDKIMDNQRRVVEAYVAGPYVAGSVVLLMWLVYEAYVAGSCGCSNWVRELRA